MSASDANETHRFIEMVDRNGFKWLLEHVVTACEVEIDDARQIRADRLTALSEHISDVAYEEA